MSGLFGTVQIAIDSADNLYALWRASDQLELAISRDHGHTWSSPLAVGAPGLHQLTLPALAAGGPGEVGITYYGSTSKTAKLLTAYITQTQAALDSDPLFYSAPINDPSHPVFWDYAGNASPRADYVGGTFDKSGTFWAGVVKQHGAPDSNGKIATEGYVGRLAFPQVGRPSSSCSDKRKFSFRLHHARSARIVRVEVFVNGKLRLRHSGHNIGRVTLKRLPRRHFVVKIVATQSSGSRVTSTRSYKGCTKGRPKTRAHHHR